jgi:CO/xanthine dehydrogenase Mo-binding subunit
MTTYQVIGKPAGRKDGPQKVTGEAIYAYDFHLPGMLFGKVLRSPHPSAHIVRIDISKAEALPGVHAVLTGADVRGHKQGSKVYDVPVLAEDVVRFAGEKVAVVAADNGEIAERACGLIEVEYEVLEPLLNPAEAMKPDARLLHPDMLSYEGYMRPLQEASNVFFRNKFGVGDVDEGFAEADIIFEDTYDTHRNHHFFFEPRACIVDADLDGRVQVWTSHKGPHGLKRNLATAIGVDAEKVLVNPLYVGGDFGGKSSPWNEPLCYFLSKKTGRPVKMVMDYQEEFMAGNPRHGAVIKVRTGVKHDGRITAHHQEHLFDTGAYAGLMPLGFLVAVDRIAANYKIPHAKFEVVQVYTNNVPSGYMRGPGEVQGTFAIESHMDEIARKLEMDPVEFRMKNILHNGDKTPMNEEYAGIRAEETLAAAITASGFHTPKAPNVGRGVAMCARTANAGETTVEVTLDPNGTAVVNTPIFEQGSGTHTVLAQIAAEILGLGYDDIRVDPWNTDAVENDSGVSGSWTIRMVVPAVHAATEQARDEILNVTAELNGWPIEQLVCEAGLVKRRDTGDSVTWGEVLSRVPDRIINGRSYSKQEGRPEHTSFIAQVAEVHVDPETGRVDLLNFVTAVDTGTVLNPMGHQGQVNGGVIMGIGYTLLEELPAEDGRITTLSFADTKIMSVSDIPRTSTVLVDSGQGNGPYSAKSIGESPILPVAPAIANAVRDAVGIRPHSLPITAEKMFDELQKV